MPKEETAVKFECVECGKELEQVDGLWFDDTHKTVCKTVQGIVTGAELEQPHTPVLAAIRGDVRDVDGDTTALNPDSLKDRIFSDVVDHADVVAERPVSIEDIPALADEAVAAEFGTPNPPSTDV